MLVMPDGAFTLPPPAWRVPEAGVRVCATRSPLSSATTRLSLPGGLTIAQILDRLDWPPELRLFAVVEIGDPLNRVLGWRIDPVNWARVRPNPGTELRVWVVPQFGGGGGGQQKNPLRSILTLAVLAAAFIFAAPLGGAILGGASATILGATVTASQLGFAVIGLVGNLLVNALVPPSAGSLSGARGRSESPTLSISGARNNPIGFQPIPRVYGRHKIAPPRFPAVSEAQGADQYVRMLFVFGYGPLELTDLRIGSTAISEFEDIEYNVLQGFADDPPLSIYTRNIFEDPFTLLLESGVQQVVASREDATEVGYEFTFQGLGRFDEDLGLIEEIVNLTVEYRLEGAVDWILHGVHNVGAATQQIYRRGFRIRNLAPGRYELRITKNSGDSTSANRLNTVALTTVRTVRPGVPVLKAGLCMLEMRMRATNQLNGVVDELTAIATSILPVWDGAAWTPAPTRHPAAILRDVWRGSANRRPIPDARIDDTRLIAWLADDPARTFDAVIDYAPTVREIMFDIAAASRAQPDVVDGQYTVFRDVPQTVTVQHFGPRNILKFSGQKAFHRTTHGLKVRFVSADSDYAFDERIVYDAGYDATNATEFDPLELFGVTDPEQAHKDGLFHLAQARLRPENFEIEVAIDALRCTRGDLVKLQHDVPQVGLAAARVVSVADNGTHATAITLDDAVPMEGGKSYGAEIRRADGVEIVAAIVTAPGAQKTLTLATPLLIADGPSAGDFVIFGEAGSVSMPCLVKSIRSAPNLGARLTLVPYAAGVYTADQGTIPAYVPLLTPDPARITPGVVEGLVLSEVLRYPAGRAVGDVVASWQPPLVGVPAYYRVFRKVLGDGTWTHVLDTPELSALVAADRVAGEVVRVAVLAVSNTGRALPQLLMASAEITLAGDVFPPADVVSVTIEEITDGVRRVRWVHTGAEADLAGFEVRVRPGADADWAAATRINAGLLPVSPWETRAIASGQQTVLVKAVDTSGNASANAASVTVTLGDVLAQNLVETTDYRAAGWTGTITNGAVDVDGSLLGDGDTGLFWPHLGELFWSGASTDLFWAKPSEPFYGGSDLLFWAGPSTDLFWGGSNPDLTYQDTVTTTVAGLLHIVADGAGARVIEYRAAGAGTWTPYVGQVQLAAGTYDIRVTATGGTARARLTVLTASVDVPDINERIDDAAIAIAGTRLTLTRTYTTIRNVVLTVQEAVGQTAVTARVVDKSTSGPLVKCYDASGTAVAGTVDADVQGY